MTRPRLEDLANDRGALDLLDQACEGMGFEQRCDFNSFLLGALSVEVSAAQMAKAIRTTQRCMARVAARRAAMEAEQVEDEPADLDHDRLTEAAQDGWDR